MLFRCSKMGDEFELVPLRRGSERLEVQLHSELDETRRPGSLQRTELRRDQFDNNGLHLAGRSDRTPEAVHVVPDIEEVSPELNPHLLADGEGLQQRHVPSLVPVTVNDVSSFISKRALNEIAGKCTRVEESTRHTRLAVGIAYDIRSSAVEPDRAATVRVRTIHEGIRDGKPVPRLSRRDPRDLAVTDQLR